MSDRLRHYHGREPEPGGFDVSNTTVYSDRGVVLKGSELEMLSCTICKKILREPQQLISCGCRCCRRCLEVITSNSEGGDGHGRWRCPIEGHEPFKKSDIRNDRGCSKEINSLEVDCPAIPPCDWRGSLVDMNAHMREFCPNAELQCGLGCGMTFQRCNEKEHLVECPKQPIECIYCQHTYNKDEEMDHYASCFYYPINCDYCQKKISSRSKYSKHLDEECASYEMTCPMHKLTGCEFKGKRAVMTEHAHQLHGILAYEKIMELVESVKVLQQDNRELVETVKQLQEENKTLVRQNDETKRGMAEMSTQLKKLESKLKKRYSKESDRYWDGVETDGLATNAKVRGVDKQSASATAVSKLRDDVENHQSQLLRLSDDVQHIQENFTQFSIAVDELRLRQDVLDVKTTNGVFIWKIPDIRRRYHDAVDRRTLSLYSPPFYTSPHGYRMCIRTYLNGDGSGKGSHVSIFFVLMKSEHDSLLPWPFRQPVRFTLINQVDSSANITEAFAPDLHSPSFQRPQAEMNVASGFPQFTKQTVLHDERFTKGNMIFIKAQIDLNGLNLQ